MSPVANTSRNAYMQAVTDGRARTQREKIVLALETCGGLTRWELHKVTGIRYTSVCGRVNSLIQSGLARDDQRERVNPDGGDRASVVELTGSKQRTFDDFLAVL